MWNGGYWDGAGGDWILFPILIVIVMVVMMLIAFRIFGATITSHGGWFNTGRPNDTPTSDSALTTLRERFARGDIAEQEYESKRAMLGRDSSGGGGR